ncbi:hypothetical protein CVV65_06440 [Kyrpidia spormannii]|uniref:LysM domain-containing protein n=1 Tax=Kyrpidia spormannii TaxID=2055160 RepID=A0A2K8N5M2_9BACL|nr:hypothetical protein CVV65_06440 [Kyrpidia spormannii]
MLEPGRNGRNLRERGIWVEIDIVRRGDTLWGISRRYGIELEGQPAWPPTAS